jgi:hypothetical protein
LPYHGELPFQKKYGVNTSDIDYRVIKTSYVPSTVPSNYTYMLYGYKFAQGKCIKTNLVNGKSVGCWNCYTTPIVAPDGSTKDLCPNHVRAEVKAYKLEIKTKAIEAKLIAKQKALEEKEAKIAAKLLEKASKVKELKPKVVKPKVVKPNTVCVPCAAILKTGSRKGESCGLKAGDNNLCKRHQSK